MSRNDNLDDVIDRRVQVYGDPVDTFERIAQVWSGILDHTIQSWEVPLLMAAMKMVRTQVMPDYSDNSDDIEGYLDIFRTLIGDDMIHARTVNEFIEKKWEPADQPDLSDYVEYKAAAGQDLLPTYDMDGFHYGLLIGDVVTESMRGLDQKQQAEEEYDRLKKLHPGVDLALVRRRRDDQEWQLVKL